MERKFSYAELVSFGNYLLSKERSSTISGNLPDCTTDVSHADIENWLEKENLTVQD